MATVAGLFPDRAAAEHAIQALQDAGFDANRIGIVMRDRRETREVADEAGVAPAAGAVTGGVIGGTLGAILAATGALVIPGIGPFVSGGILATALVGGVTGWLVGGLVALGIPHEDAEYYQGQVEQGRVLVTVDATGREDEARATLLRSGAENLREPASDTGDAYQRVTAANQPVDAATTPVPGQPIGVAGTTAPLEPPSDTFYDTSAVNPSGTTTQPLPNEQTAAAQRSAAPAESDAPQARVILPPEYVAHPRAAQNYGISDTPDEPLQGSNSGLAGSTAPTTNDVVPNQEANSGVAGTSAPSVDDAVPMAGPTTPRPDGSVVNPASAQDAASGEADIIRDDDIIRQEQQRME